MIGKCTVEIRVNKKPFVRAMKRIRFKHRVLYLRIFLRTLKVYCFNLDKIAAVNLCFAMIVLEKRLKQLIGEDK